MTPWMPPALMNHLWQSTLFTIVVWLATLALRKNIARVRCWLWTAASVKFLVSFSMLVRLGERFQWHAAPAAVQPAVTFMMEDILAPAAVVDTAPAPVPHSASLLPWGLFAIWALGAASFSCHGGASGCLSDRRCATRRHCDSTRSTVRMIWPSCHPPPCLNPVLSASVALDCCFRMASSNA